MGHIFLNVRAPMKRTPFAHAKWLVLTHHDTLHVPFPTTSCPFLGFTMENEQNADRQSIKLVDREPFGSTLKGELHHMDLGQS